MDNLGFARLFEILMVINRAEAKRVKEQFTVAAFVGFQMGAGGEKTFAEYLAAIGLSVNMQKTVPPISKEEAIAKGEKIRQKAKKIRKREKS